MLDEAGWVSCGRDVLMDEKLRPVYRSELPCKEQILIDVTLAIGKYIPEGQPQQAAEVAIQAAVKPLRAELQSTLRGLRNLQDGARKRFLETLQPGWTGKEEEWQAVADAVEGVLGMLNKLYGKENA